MESLLPSEIARLVYGYLKDEGCSEAAKFFLETSVHLTECQKISKQGRRFHTRVMGRSLVDMLDVFCTVYTLVQDRLNNSQDVITNSSLLSSLQHFLSENDTVREVNPIEPATYTPVTTKVDDVSSASGINSGLKPHATSTPYSTSVLPNRPIDGTPSVSGNCARKHLLTEDVSDKEKGSVDPEELQKYMKSVNRALLDNTQIHEKLAEKINEKRTATENQSLDTLGRNIVMEIDIDNIIDEIIDSAKVYEAKSKDQSLCKQNNCKPLDDNEIETEALEISGDSQKNKNRLQESASSMTSTTEENAAVVDSPLKGGDSVTSRNGSSEPSNSLNGTVMEQQITNSNQPVSSSSKNIIEKAMISSFISPVKSCSPVKSKSGEVSVSSDDIRNKNISEPFSVSEQGKQISTIIPFDSNVNFGSSINVLTQSAHSQEQFQNNTAVVFSSLPNIASSLPNIAPANFVLASPMLTFNIAGQPIVNPPVMPSTVPKLKHILPAPVSGVTYNGPAMSNPPVVANSSVVVVSSHNSISSSNIFTSESTPVRLLPPPEHTADPLQGNTDGTDKPSKVLIENVPWRKKKSVHVRACDKIVRRRLTKITPKPSPVIQESIFTPGATTVLSNGVAVEVLNQNTITQPDIPVENSSVPNTPNMCLEETDTCINNTVLPSVNDSNSLVIDTSVYDSTCVSSQNDVDKDKTVDCVVPVSDNSVITTAVKEGENLSADINVENVKNLKESTENLKENLPDLSTQNESRSDDKKNVSTESQSKKNKTPGHMHPVNKRRSMSTPRRNNHIRALDFSTPDRHTKQRKTNTSPKSASRLKSKLPINNIVRSGLFKSPENKVDVQKNDEVVPKKDDLEMDALLSTEVPPMIGTDIVGTPVKPQVEKDSSLNTPKITSTAPANDASSPVPKLAGDWDAISGLGMIVGEGKCNKQLNKEPCVKITPLSWDAQLRSFVDTNQKLAAARPKRHTRRKIGGTKQMLKEKKNTVNKETSKTKGSKKLITDQAKKVNKKQLPNNKKLRNRSTIINTRSRTLAKKKKTAEETLNDDKDIENSSSSSTNSPFCNTSNETETMANDELSSDLALKIERNLLNSDSTGLETNFNNPDNNCDVVSSLSKEVNDPKENEILHKTVKCSDNFLIPEESVSRRKKSPENNTFLQFPLLETPMKSIDSVAPQTPIVTPFLKSIEQNTKVLLLTPGFPPTPAALRDRESNFQTPVNVANTESLSTPLKNSNSTPIKSNALEQELIAECRRIENISKPKPQDERGTILSQEAVPNNSSKMNETQPKKDNVDNSGSSIKVPVSSPIKEPLTLTGNANSIDKSSILPNKTSGLNNKEKSNELKKSGKEDKILKSKSKDSVKKKKVKSSKMKKNSKDKLISGFLRQAVHSVFGSSCSSSESDSDLKSQPNIIKKQPISDIKAVGVDTPVVPKLTQEPCDSDNTKSIPSTSKSVDSVSPKPKKYVKTILLSPTVKSKARLEKEIVTPNKIETNFHSCKNKDKAVNDNKVESNLDDVALQRSILDKKLQRTIDVLKGPTKRSKLTVKPKDLNISNSTINKRNRKVTSKAIINSSDDSSNDQINDKSKIVQPVLKQQNKIDLKTLQAQEDNAVTSPLKQHCSGGNGLILHSVDTQNTLSPGNVKKNSKTESILNDRAKNVKCDKDIKQPAVLPSNEGYLHVVYDEEKAIPIMKKSFDDINDFEMTICAEDDSQDITCKLRVDPLQTLLEILPSKNCKENIQAHEVENSRCTNPHRKVDNEFYNKDKTQGLDRSKGRSSSSDKHKSQRREKEHVTTRRPDPIRDRESSDRSNGRFSSRHEREFHSSDLKHRIYEASMKERFRYVNDKRYTYYDGKKHVPHSSRSPVDIMLDRSKPHNFYVDRYKSPSNFSTDRRHKSKFLGQRRSVSRSPAHISHRHSPKSETEKKYEFRRREKSTNQETSRINEEEQVHCTTKASNKPVSNANLPSKLTLDDNHPAVKVNLPSSKVKESSNKTSANQKNSLRINTEPAPDTDDVEEGEIISECGDNNLDSEICGDDLMDLAVVTSKQHSTTRISTTSTITSSRKRKASSDNMGHIVEKKQKPDDAQRLLKNLDSEDLEHFLSAVHSETENI